MTKQHTPYRTQTVKMPAMLPLYVNAAMHSANVKDWKLSDVCLTIKGWRCDKAKLRSYCQSIGVNKVGGYLPPAYPQIISFPLQMKLMTRKDFPFKLLGLVHLSQSVTQHQPLDINSKLDLEVKFDGHIPHRKGVVFFLKTDVYNQGELVWEGRSGYLFRHRKIADADALKSTPLISDSDLATLSFPQPLKSALPITRRYAFASGDINPIHMSGITAKLLGFKKPIAHGMWLLSAALAKVVPANGNIAIECEFKNPVLLPRSLYIKTDQPIPASRFAVFNEDGEEVHIVGRIAYQEQQSN
ncbi:MaoC family dehydratase [Veronia pacifica]|uniref:MaoC-like domain-containing protein n=1 Tax=Veronia pacifica TaxID=1080227 RepID=A0A1C3EIB6_9GAMM|nr:MaoC/PaaZ C-terminal domain-containing protein [Veronia pacifica]ODA32986.1 hypothetical protein A8L45_11860 [Veronia pacifica]